MPRTKELSTPVDLLGGLNRTIDDFKLSIEQKRAEADEMERILIIAESTQEQLASTMLTTTATVLHGPKRRRRPRHNSHNGSGVTRKQMLQTIITNAPRPVTVDEIVAEMAKHGREDDRALVSSTLSYLKRIGVAKNLERGLWTGVTEVKQKKAA
jgi:hypothetical protein